MRLHISGLDQNTTADDISTLFKSFRDQVAAIDMIYSKHDGKCSGFCYVELCDKNDNDGDDKSRAKATDTYAKLKSLYQNTVFRGGKLKISEAKAKRKRQTKDAEQEPRDDKDDAAPPLAQLELITKKNYKQYPSWQKLNNGKLVRKMYVRLAPNSGISSISSTDSAGSGVAARGRIQCIDPKTHFPKDKYIKFREYDIEEEASKQKSILNALLGEEGDAEQDDASFEEELPGEEELTGEEAQEEAQEEVQEEAQEEAQEQQEGDDNEDDEQESDAEDIKESEEEDCDSEHDVPELQEVENKGDDVMKLSTDIKDLFFGSESNNTFKLGLLPEADQDSGKGSMDQATEKQDEDLSNSQLDALVKPEPQWPFLFHIGNHPETTTSPAEMTPKPNQDFLSQFSLTTIEIPFTLLKDDYKKRSCKYKRRNNKK